MGKHGKHFRLSEQAVKHLEAIAYETGSNHTAVVENALALHRALLKNGWDPQTPATAESQAAPPAPSAPEATRAPEQPPNSQGESRSASKLTRQQLRAQAREKQKRGKQRH